MEKKSLDFLCGMALSGKRFKGKKVTMTSHLYHCTRRRKEWEKGGGKGEKETVISFGVTEARGAKIKRKEGRARNAFYFNVRAAVQTGERGGKKYREKKESSTHNESSSPLSLFKTDGRGGGGKKLEERESADKGCHGRPLFSFF